MDAITKVSQITTDDLAEYIRLQEVTEADTQTLNNLLGVAKVFIKNFTGRDDLDEFEDFVIVCFVLVQDMWDNRTLYVDETNLNYVVETILNGHSVNLLPQEESE